LHDKNYHYNITTGSCEEDGGVHDELTSREEQLTTNWKRCMVVLCQVRINDGGGRQQYAEVLIEGVLARGVIDSGAKISIINGKLFSLIAAIARLKKSRLKPPDRISKTPQNVHTQWTFMSALMA
jgi:hypothetical protein